jgi:hypothetical protein
VGAGADVDHRMLTHLLQLRVVPAAPDSVAFVFVRGVGRPLRGELAGGRFGEVHEDLLPVRLVIVGAIESRAPVVERVEQPVLQNDPAILAEHPTVVGVMLVFGQDVRVGGAARGRRAPGHPSPSQEGYREESIRNAGDVTDPSQTTPPGTKVPA